MSVSNCKTTFFACSMMLDKDPEDRATVTQLLAHKWFKVGCKLMPVCACE